MCPRKKEILLSSIPRGPRGVWERQSRAVSEENPVRQETSGSERPPVAGKAELKGVWVWTCDSGRKLGDAEVMGTDAAMRRNGEEHRKG